MKATKLISYIENRELDSRICEIYKTSEPESQKKRYINAINNFISLYGDKDVSLFSVSGRSELSGNHTDHNRGCVIAGAIDLDVIAVASPSESNEVFLKSEGYDEINIDIDKYNTVDPSLFGTSDSIIAGMCSIMKNKGYNVGGFYAYMTSNVLKGSGLSSSAAFEDMIGNIENHLYNNGEIDNVEIAKMSQYAENVFFGKPCGLMDQVACAHGGIVSIDFCDTNAPKITKIDLDLTKEGYNLCIVDTGGNHADLTDDYAAIPYEMKSVAKFFNKSELRDVKKEQVIANIKELRKYFGDRAILRSLHFFNENERVNKQIDALNNNDIKTYFEIVKDSGRSSFEYLQNVYTTKNVSEQGLSLALALCDEFLKDKDGAFRVHGGGFAGTVQAYIKSEDVEKFKKLMDSAFYDGACLVLKIRHIGACKVF